MANVSAFVVVRSFLVDLVRFPWWWYTDGLLKTVRFCSSAIAGYTRSLALRVWVTNLFVPMFGQYDWQSRIISFFMRLAQIFGRVLVIGVWTVLMGFLLVGYVIAPMVTAGLFLYHALGGAAAYVS